MLLNVAAAIIGLTRGGMQAQVCTGRAQVLLGWAAFKVITLAQRSISMHKNPAYILYSDPTCLNKWGFLYVQYRATAYYFVIPVLGYLLVKGLFIAFGQNVPVVQAVAFLIIEAAFLVAVSVLRPWMDKRTNIFNISIAACNFLNDETQCEGTTSSPPSKTSEREEMATT